MKTYKTLQYGNVYTEARYFDEHLLRNLEIMAHEVKCRKPCHCTTCGSLINAGDTALKTSQKHHNDSILRNNYCSDCYQIIA